MKDKPIFDLQVFFADKAALETAALVHLLPAHEKAEILEIVRGRLIKEWTAEKENA